MTASTVSNALPEESNTAIPSTGATHFSQTDAPTPSLHGCGSPSSIVAFLLFALPNPASDVSTLMRPRAAKLSANGSAGEMRRTTALLLFTMPALLCTITWYALPSSRATQHENALFQPTGGVFHYGLGCIILSRGPVGPLCGPRPDQSAQLVRTDTSTAHMHEAYARNDHSKTHTTDQASPDDGWVPLPDSGRRPERGRHARPSSRDCRRRTHLAGTVERAAALSADHDFDVCVLNYVLPDGKGSAFYSSLRERGVLTPCIMLTGAPEINVAVELTRNGLFEYLTKPVALHRLLECLQRAVAHSAATQSSLQGFGLGDSSCSMHVVRERVRQAAANPHAN